MKDEDLYRTAAQGDAASAAALLARAESGEPGAMVWMARLLDVGASRDVAPDVPRARAWYERAARSGHPEAQYALGNMYDYGEGGPQDDESARHWYELAASQGVRDAQMHYARMLECGRGGRWSLEEAAHWYRKAVDQGDELAATNLGAMHFRHQLDVSSDLTAIECFAFAAEKLDGLAHYFLSQMYLHGRGVERHGGMGLLHACIAALLLPPGTNRDTAIDVREHILEKFPAFRDDFEQRALAYVIERGGVLPS